MKTTTKTAHPLAFTITFGGHATGPGSPSPSGYEMTITDADTGKEIKDTVVAALFLRHVKTQLKELAKAMYQQVCTEHPEVPGRLLQHPLQGTVRGTFGPRESILPVDFTYEFDHAGLRVIDAGAVHAVVLNAKQKDTPTDDPYLQECERIREVLTPLLSKLPKAKSAAGQRLWVVDLLRSKRIQDENGKDKVIACAAYPDTEHGAMKHGEMTFKKKPNARGSTAHPFIAILAPETGLTERQNYYVLHILGPGRDRALYGTSK